MSYYLWRTVFLTGLMHLFCVGGVLGVGISLIDGLYAYGLWRVTHERWFVDRGATFVMSPACSAELSMMMSLSIAHGMLTKKHTLRSYLIRSFVAMSIKSCHAWTLDHNGWYREYTQKYSHTVQRFAPLSYGIAGPLGTVITYAVTPDARYSVGIGLLSLGLHHYFVHTHAAAGGT